MDCLKKDFPDLYGNITELRNSMICEVKLFYIHVIIGGGILHYMQSLNVGLKLLFID